MKTDIILINEGDTTGFYEVIDGYAVKRDEHTMFACHLKDGKQDGETFEVTVDGLIAFANGSALWPDDPLSEWALGLTADEVVEAELDEAFISKRGIHAFYGVSESDF